MAITESVKIVFEVDNSVLQSTVDKLVALNKISQEDAASFKALSDASKAAGASMSQAAKGANDLATAEKNVAKASSEVAISAKGLKTVADELKATSASAASASEAFVPLKKQVREARLELEQLEERFGATSQEAFEARERVGALTARLDDLNRQTKLIEPEDKIKAFTALGQSVVGAFSVATGALQAFGAENEEVQKIAQKLQGALNIVQGLQSIIQLKEAYEDIRAVLGFTTAAQTALTTAQTTGTVATNAGSVAMRGFAAALASTGVGAFIVALGALAGAFLLVGNGAGDAATKSQALLDLEERAKKLADERIAAELRLRVAKGEITEDEAKQIETSGKINKSLDEQRKRVEEIKKEYGIILDTYETFVKAGNEADFFGSRTEEAGNIVREFQQLQKNIEAEAQNAEINQTAFQREELNKRKEQAAKTVEDQKKRNKELADSAKEAEEARLKALQDNQARIDAENAATAALKQQFEQELANQLADIDKQTADKRLQNQITFFDNRQALEEQNIQDEIIAAQQRADKIAEFYGEDSQAYKNAIAQKTLLEKQYTALVIKNSESISASVDESLDEQLKSLTIFYQNELLFNAKSLGDSQARNAADLKAYKKFLEDKIAALKAAGKSTTEAETQLANTNTSIAKNEESEKAEIQQSIANTAIATSEFIGQLSKNRLDNEIFELEQAREKGLITEEQYQEKLKALKIKQAKNDKELAIFAATVQFSQALINALTTTPASAAPAALAFTAAIAGINLAKVIATPIPKFKQGTLAVPGYDTGDDSVMAMLRPGEAVIPTETNREYSAIIKSIYKREIPASEFNDFLANRNQPVFDFNKVTLDALYKRDIRTSALNSAVMKRTGGEMPTFKVKADVDTYALSRAMAKNKGVDVNNADYLAQAIASELKKGINPRQLL